MVGNKIILLIVRYCFGNTINAQIRVNGDIYSLGMKPLVITNG